MKGGIKCTGKYILAKCKKQNIEIHINSIHKKHIMECNKHIFGLLCWLYELNNKKGESGKNCQKIISWDW